MIHVFKKLTRWTMPHACLFCRQITRQPLDLCLPCSHSLPILQQTCKICANLLPDEITHAFCGQCLQEKPPFDETYSLFSYRPPIVKLILDLKFHHQFAHAKLLGELMVARIRKDWYLDKSLPAAIIPMPLHFSRLQERGFNQAVEIARPMTKLLKIPLLLHAVRRVKPTLAQATLSAKQRVDNIHNAFQVNHDFSGQHVAVLDDVVTTGSTIREISQQLKKHGATKISIWCCAKRI